MILFDGLLLLLLSLLFPMSNFAFRSMIPTNLILLSNPIINSHSLFRIVSSFESMSLNPALLIEVIFGLCLLCNTLHSRMKTKWRIMVYPLNWLIVNSVSNGKLQDLLSIHQEDLLLLQLSKLRDLCIIALTSSTIHTNDTALHCSVNHQLIFYSPSGQLDCDRNGTKGGQRETINMRWRTTGLVACKMCGRTWNPYEDKSICDWSYVGTHQWRQYPSNNDPQTWAYAASLIRIS